MPIDLKLLFYGIVFVAALLTVEGAVMLADSRRTEGKIRQRLLVRKVDGTVAIEELRRRRNRDDGLLVRLERFGPLRVLDRLLVQAGARIPTTRFLAFVAAATLVVFLVLRLSLVPGPKALAAAAALCVGLPLLVLHVRRRRRIKLFARQLLGALDTIVRSLRAGHPINAALQMVADQMPSPIRDEIGLVVDEMTYGLDLTESLVRLSQRVEQDELRFVVAAIRIQHKSGGNLAEVLSGLCAVMRERDKMLKKAKALSAEGRFSAVVLCALPLAVTGLIQLVSPNYYLKVVHDPLFVTGSSVAGTLIAVGIFVIWRMVNIKV